MVPKNSGASCCKRSIRMSSRRSATRISERGRIIMQMNSNFQLILLPALSTYTYRASVEGHSTAGASLFIICSRDCIGYLQTLTGHSDRSSRATTTYQGPKVPGTSAISHATPAAAVPVTAPAAAAAAVLAAAVALACSTRRCNSTIGPS
jgi:hypothetical protein